MAGVAGRGDPALHNGRRPAGGGGPAPEQGQEVPKSAFGGPGWRPAQGGPSHKLLPNGRGRRAWEGPLYRASALRLVCECLAM